MGVHLLIMFENDDKVSESLWGKQSGSFKIIFIYLFFRERGKEKGERDIDVRENH